MLRQKLKTYEHRFVEHVPEQLEPGVLYVSIPYASVLHLCFCGCGCEVVTPLSPVKWRLTFDGETVSLAPSVGSWSLRCQSHYWLSGGRVRWAKKFSRQQIEDARRADRTDQATHLAADRSGRKKSGVRRLGDFLLGRGDRASDSKQS